MYLKKILSEENIKKKIDSLLKQLQEQIGVADDEIDELKKIMELTDFSHDKE